MISKIQDWKISFRNLVYHLYESVPFTEKRPRRPETGVKDDFEEMDHEFPFGTFSPEKEDNLIRCSVVAGNYPWNDPNSRVPFTFYPDFPELFVKGNLNQNLPIQEIAVESF